MKRIGVLLVVLVVLAWIGSKLVQGRAVGAIKP